MVNRQRQEVLNVILAQLLQDRGVVVAPETILKSGENQKRQMPDVIVNYQGLRTAIEGEVESATAHEKAIASATRRVETGIAHIGIGVVYPAHLRTVDFSVLKNELANASLQIAVITEAEKQDFVTGDVNYLERVLRTAFQHLVKKDVVAEAVALLDSAVDRFAATVISYKGVWGRITQELTGFLSDKELDDLNIAQRIANCHIGGLVLMNALIFQDILSGHNRHVKSLSRVISEQEIDALSTSWQYILENINYYSIFHLALEILHSLSDSVVGLPEMLSFMAQTALNISRKRAALRHDLMGRIYHRLLTEAKYLGTYYTSIPAAQLLLKLALRPENFDPSDSLIKWERLDNIAQLRIADLACGTGTLLMAAADGIIDNYVSKSAAEGHIVQLDELHQQIAEEVLHGYDVLPSAIHLTASTVALRSPDVPFKKMHLYALPYSGSQNKLGSLEFLSGNLTSLPLDLFGAETEGVPKQMPGSGVQERYISLPELDLCVMNPPFVRSVGGNLLFGSVPEKSRAKMQKRLKRLVSNSRVQANITSGLGV